jgi:hypothetical protein
MLVREAEQELKKWEDRTGKECLLEGSENPGCLAASTTRPSQQSSTIRISNLLGKKAKKIIDRKKVNKSIVISKAVAYL